MKEDDKLIKIFSSVFPNANIPKNLKELQLGNPKEWDSLGHFSFLMSVEETYNLKFSMEQMSNITTFNQILEIINNPSHD
jgi:acyl carrier protein